MSDQEDYRSATIEEFFKRLNAGRSELWAFIDSLTPEQLSAKRDTGGWAIKDHLIHLAMWEKGMTALMSYQPRYAAMGLDEAWVFNEHPHFDVMNDVIFKQHKDKSADEVLAVLRDEQAAFSRVMSEKTTADLFKTYSHFQPHEPGDDDGSPILGRLVGNSFGHYAEHLPWIRALV